MNRIVACVPNFSEGRNQATVQALVAAVKSVPHVWLLDESMDADHHRAVLTFVGSPEGVIEAAWRAIRRATELIDLRKHEGVHPRVGATDVVPFVPVRGVTIEDCVRLARQLGQRVGQELGIPVFLYERAATRPEHAPLETIRRGGLEGLRFRMQSDAHWLPDFGPPHVHLTAGAIVIGARPPLIAFNVNLRSQDVGIARAIAKAIRQSCGGYPCVKAIGVELASRGLVQVSMNLTDYHVTSLYSAFQIVKAEAAKRGVEVMGSELIGLVPQAALEQAAAESLQLEGFDGTRVLETKIAAVMSGPSTSEPSVSGFLDAVASATPTPAGGSVAALVGALAASLGVMGARLGHDTNQELQLGELARRLRTLIQEDVEAYKGLTAAYQIPKNDPDRARAVSMALHKATEVPLEVAELACEAGSAIHSCLAAAKPAVHSDLTVGMFMAVAAVEAGLHTVRVNLKSQSDQEVSERWQDRMAQATASLEELRALCYTPPS